MPVISTVTPRRATGNAKGPVCTVFSLQLPLTPCIQLTFHRQSLHMSQLAHLAGAYPGFYSIKRLGIFLLLLDTMLVHRRFTPRINFACTLVKGRHGETGNVLLNNRTQYPRQEPAGKRTARSNAPH